MADHFCKGSMNNSRQLVTHNNLHISAMDKSKCLRQVLKTQSHCAAKKNFALNIHTSFEKTIKL